MVDPSIGAWEENIQELSMYELIESINELLSGRTESEMIRGLTLEVTGKKWLPGQMMTEASSASQHSCYLASGPSTGLESGT